MVVMTIVYFIIALLVTELLRPKPDLEDAKPAGAGDFKFPTAEEGRPWPLLWGTVQLAGPNVIWWGDLQQKAIKETVSTGMFSSEEIITGFEYKVGIQFALCRGGEYPVDELRRVWNADDLVYDGGGAESVVTDGDTFLIDEPKLYGGNDLGNGGLVGTLKLHSGPLTQAVSGYLTAFQTESGQQLAYNGRCYVAPSTERVYVGNSSSIKPWKFELRRTPNPLALSSAVVNTLDANPMNVLYEILTSVEFPLQIDPTLIDTANFAAVGEVLETEGNGFSMLLDRKEEALDLIRRIEDQVSGFLYFDAIAGLWRVTLARADYDIDTVPELNDTNVLEFVDFSRGSWEDTSNEVRVSFVDRGDSYKDTVSPPAQDGANIRIQGGRRIPATFTMSGVKDPDLASVIAWRKLRSLATPLAKGQVICDRSLYATNPGDVLALTDSDMGFTKLPVRVIKVNHGEFGESKITIDFVQDIFFAAAASGGSAQGTLWEPPADSLEGFVAAQQLAFEAPRALTTRDPLTTDPSATKIFASARRKGVEVRYKIYSRLHPSAHTYSGDPVEIGQVYGFVLIGELLNNLGAGSAYPFNNLAVVAAPDSGSDILAAFPPALTPEQVGTELTTLLMIGDEFFLVAGSVTQPANIDIDGVYRGALDSVQVDHSSGDPVFLLFVGSGMSAAAVPVSYNVEVRLAPSSLSDDLAPMDGGVTAIELKMQQRAKLPYPPSELSVNGSRFGTTASLEGSGAGEGVGILLAFLRRDFRAPDEIAQLGVDAGTLFADFPAANSTTHDVETIDDPDGSPASLGAVDFGSAISGVVTRLAILKATNGALPTRLRFEVAAVHDFEDQSGLESYYPLGWSFDVTSALTGLFEFTALDASDVSAVYTSTVTGQYDFVLSSAFTAGDVEYRIDGGSWLQLIAAGLTTGNIASVTSGETIEVRHLSSDSSTEKLLSMAAAGAGQDGFAVLFT